MPRPLFKYQIATVNNAAKLTAWIIIITQDLLERPRVLRRRALSIQNSRSAIVNTAIKTYDTVLGTNRVCPSRTKKESYGRLTDPDVPRIQSFKPRKASRPARVMTKAGTPKRMCTKEYNRPITIAAPTLPKTAIYTGNPDFTMMLASIAADSPLTEPTERSIFPTSRTHTTPRAIMPRPALCIDRKSTRLNSSHVSISYA